MELLPVRAVGSLDLLVAKNSIALQHNHLLAV